MRHNGHKPIRLSELPVSQVSVRPGERVQVVCPGCATWRLARRSMLTPHRAPDGVRRCPGSGQRLVADIAVGAAAPRLAIAERDAALRHGSRSQRTPVPPVPMPVCRMGRAA